MDYQGKLSSQLANPLGLKVVYQRSGSWLAASVIPAQIIADGTLNWYASENTDELHYLAAIFNAPALADFFKDHCRSSDRHFQMSPVENLPIPQFDPDNQHHANLAAQSMLAHQRVATIVAERQAAARRTARNYILNDPAMQPIPGRHRPVGAGHPAQLLLRRRLGSRIPPNPAPPPNTCWSYCT